MSIREIDEKTLIGNLKEDKKIVLEFLNYILPNIDITKRAIYFENIKNSYGNDEDIIFHLSDYGLNLDHCHEIEVYNTFNLFKDFCFNNKHINCISNVPYFFELLEDVFIEKYGSLHWKSYGVEILQDYSVSFYNEYNEKNIYKYIFNKPTPLDNLSSNCSEHEFEEAFNKEIETIGGFTYKLSASVTKGAPDRVVISPSGNVFFVEFKKPSTGGIVSEEQKEQIRIIKSTGNKAFILNDIQNAKKFIEILKDEDNRK